MTVLFFEKKVSSTAKMRSCADKIGSETEDARFSNVSFSMIRLYGLFG